MFSLTSNAGVFEAAADMLVVIYRATCFHLICTRVDNNFFIVQLPGQMWTEDEFIQLAATLGIREDSSASNALAVHRL